MKSLFIITLLWASSALGAPFKICVGDDSHFCIFGISNGSGVTFVTDDDNLVVNAKQFDTGFPIRKSTPIDQAELRQGDIPEIQVHDQFLDDMWEDVQDAHWGCNMSGIACSLAISGTVYAALEDSVESALVPFGSAVLTCLVAVKDCRQYLKKYKEYSKAYDQRTKEQFHPHSTGGENPGGPATGFPTASNPTGGGTSTRCQNMPTTIVSHRDGTGSGSTTTPGGWECNPITGPR